MWVRFFTESRSFITEASLLERPPASDTFIFLLQITLINSIYFIIFIVHKIPDNEHIMVLTK